jgi:hypothetical protein
MYPRSNDMTPRILEDLSTWLVDCSPFAILGNAKPPRDPDDEDDDEDEDEEDEDRPDEAPVVREPDED